MDPRKLFVDERIPRSGFCVYCGAEANTRDHVPSKIFLEDPLPDDLPVVSSCEKCNGGFSLDEQYFGCFVECVISGSTSPDSISRPKIRRILGEQPKLAERILAARRLNDEGNPVWHPEMDRVKNIVTKLARGHAAFELSTPLLEPPDRVQILPLISMPESDRRTFEAAGSGEPRGWPEIGSRAFFRACGAPPYDGAAGPWVTIQQSRYRYSVDEPGGVTVRIVLAEYLACMVDWESS